MTSELFETRVRNAPTVRAIVSALPGRARMELIGLSAGARISEIITTDEARALYEALGNYLAYADGAGVPT